MCNDIKQFPERVGALYETASSPLSRRSVLTRLANVEKASEVDWLPDDTKRLNTAVDLEDAAVDD